MAEALKLSASLHRYANPPAAMQQLRAGHYGQARTGQGKFFDWFDFTHHFSTLRTCGTRKFFKELFYLLLLFLCFWDKALPETDFTFALLLFRSNLDAFFATLVLVVLA